MQKWLFIYIKNITIIFVHGCIAKFNTDSVLPLIKEKKQNKNNKTKHLLQGNYFSM